MERMEQLELVRRQLQLAVSWSDKTAGAAGQERLGHLVTQRLEDTILRLQTGESKDMKLSLGWTSNREMFSKAVRENFGQFSDQTETRRMIKAGDTNISPKLLVSDHGGSNKVKYQYYEKRNNNS